MNNFAVSYQHFMQQLGHSMNGNGWIIQVALVIGITAILSFAIAWTIKNIITRLQKTKKHWDKIVLKSLNLPLQALIWVLGIAYVGDIIRQATGYTAIFQFIKPFREIGVVAALVWLAIRISHFGEKYYADKRIFKEKAVDLTTVHTVGKIIRITIIVLAALVVMQTLGFSISGIVAFGGVGGVIVGFAAKDLLANFFGGLVIALDRPFKVGDWINSPDRNIEGTVEEIGWRLTRIRTFDKRPLYLPNSAFLTIAVVNPSRMQNRRIKTTIGIRYDDWQMVKSIVDDVEAMLKKHPEIDTNQTLFVKLVNFGPSSLDLLVYTFTKTINWVQFQDVQQDVFLKIMEIIAKHNAECAFPTSTLHIPQGLHLEKSST